MLFNGPMNMLEKGHYHRVMEICFSIMVVEAPECVCVDPQHPIRTQY